ncbi:MAG: site-specific DNA-methyltransferase [Segatella copri]
MAKKIDLGALRQQILELQIDKELKHDLLEVINEKKHYGLVWEESSEAAWDDMQDQLPVFVEDESKRLDSAPEGSPNHLLIEGDNLNALTALTYAYAGKIDVIYIDPPYNTGNKDFIYNDSFVDKDDSFRHSKWLSFMDRRLRIAKKLLSEKGVMFISIDENEEAQLKMLCDKIYGENNHIATLPTIMNLKGNQDEFGFAGTHEYTHVYCLSRENSSIGYLPVEDEELDDWLSDDKGFYKKGANLKSTGVNAPKEKRPYLFYPILVNIETKVVSTISKDEYVRIYDKELKLHDEVYLSQLQEKYESLGYTFLLPITGGKGMSWRWGWQKVKEEADEIIVNINGIDVSLYKKQRPQLGDLPSKKPKSVFYRPEYSSGNGKAELVSVLGENLFGYPKPLNLIIDFLRISAFKDSTILDFFAGSGTTLHATMQLNSEDGGHRKCILVTNNENNICEKVTYERNKRVINGYTNQKGEEVPGLTHNNLRYYKTEFVPRDQSSSKSRRALMASLVDLLCIKNNIYKEQETFGGKKFKKNVLRYFKDEAGQMLVVLDERVVSIIIPMIAEVATRQNPLKVYVYSDGAYAYEDEFHKVMPVIELCAMPDAFLQALEGGTDILPKQKYSEAMMKEFQQNEALAMQNEEVVKEVLSDDYDYVPKEKEDNVTNDIIE